MVERGDGVDLRGRVAVVTGASRPRGIGAAVCRALAAGGADLFFTHWTPFDRTQPAGADEAFPAAFERELRGAGVRCASMALDLGATDAHLRLLDAVAGRLGPPAILVNNAAHSAPGGYAALDAAALDAHYAVNMRGAFLLSAEFARRWPGGAGGRIVFFTSGQSLHPMPDELAYAATKGAIEAFTRSLAAGVAGRGITVNAIDPGATDTGWMTEAIKEELLPRSPLCRLGQPEDAARLVAFLASDAAAWITGQIIHSRGGM